jgi:hypothetical protein
MPVAVAVVAGVNDCETFVVVGWAVAGAPVGVGVVDGTAEDNSNATAGAGEPSGRTPDGVALPDRASPAEEVGGGQPSNEGESINPATANTSSAAPTLNPMTLERRRRCRPVVGDVAGISLVGCDAQLIRAPYGPVCGCRKPGMTSMHLHS